MQRVIPLTITVLLALLSCSKQESCAPELPVIQLSIGSPSQGLAVTRSEPVVAAVIPAANGCKASLELEIEDNNLPTRAIQVTTPDIDAIGVWAKLSEGANYFYDVTFKKTVSEGLFISDPVYRWPGLDSLDFCCYYPCSEKFRASGLELSGKDASPSISYETPGNAYSHKDLLVAYTGMMADGVVDARMKHALASISFRVGKNLPVGTKISSIEIRKIIGSGIISLTDPGSGWTLDDSNHCSPFVGFNEGEEWTMTDSRMYGDVIGSYFFLLPQTIGDNCTVQIFTKTGSTLTPFEFKLDGQWEMGKSYNFYLN